MAQEIPIEMVNTNDLPHIDDVEPLNESDAACINEIREVLKRHSALDRFGVTLLHKHFQLESDEMLVEVTNEENRTQKILPMKKKSIDKFCVAQTAWRLSDNKATLGCYSTCIRGPNNSWSIRHVTMGN